jgi:multiple sugar transport system substrate-binding protein
VARGPVTAVGREQARRRNWGGWTSAVITGTKNPIAAAKFAEFLNTDPASTTAFATEQFLFPATKALLSDPAFTQ